jgi:FMN-dependent oxidoreductase (nitrilotriacetate monooxygenase family)
VNDPLQIVPPMALVTRHLGFGVTCSVSFEHPYTFARRMSTLDHLTKGRAAWNIVTSYLESGARNIGQAGQVRHDDRYDVGDEYLEVCYKLWEGSWQDDAVVRDTVRRVFTDPAKVHPIAHEGRFFTVPGMHLCEPSPQRTPVLYQAGTSGRGRNFAAQHAECVFIAAPSAAIAKDYVTRIRRQAAEYGRDPRDILVFALMTVVVAQTDAEALQKLAVYRSFASLEGGLTLMSGWTGIDLGQFAPDHEVSYIESNAVQSLVEAIANGEKDKRWTVRELGEWAAIGGVGPVVAGSAASVADALQRWVDDTDCDGFNLAYAVTHETFRDVVDLLVPELQRRGAYKTAYAPGTLREKLFGGGARLSAPHPGARYRDLAAHREVVDAAARRAPEPAGA